MPFVGLPMPRRSKQKKAKVAKAFAIASAVIFLLTFIVREILKDNLKDLHDSLAKAESEFRNESGQSLISLQILTSQEQAELVRLQEGKRAGKFKATQDFAALIAQDTGRAQEILAGVNSDFDSASRLIDAFPRRARDLRNLREQVRGPLEKMNVEVRETLKPTPEHDLSRFLAVKVAMISTLLEAIPIAVLGDRALTSARRLQDASELLISICSGAIYFLGVLGLLLAVYAAIAGIKSESGE